MKFLKQYSHSFSIIKFSKIWFNSRFSLGSGDSGECTRLPSSEIADADELPLLVVLVAYSGSLLLSTSCRCPLPLTTPLPAPLPAFVILKESTWPLYLDTPDTLKSKGCGESGSCCVWDVKLGGGCNNIGMAFLSGGDSLLLL